MAFAPSHDPVGADFYMGSQVVGAFTGGSLPTTEGVYPYEPYRGPGHLNLQMELKASRMPRCFYETNAQRVFFVVIACPAVGMLSLTGFEVEHA